MAERSDSDSDLELNPKTNDQFIKQTIGLAWEARKAGDHPFAAVLVYKGKVILTAVNTVNRDNDPTQHAELRLVSQAAKQYSKNFLQECTVFSSTEPCVMCSGAIYWTGIRKVVFGCSAEKLGEYAGGSLSVPCHQVFNCGRHSTQVVGPICEERAEQVHFGFWSS